MEIYLKKIVKENSLLVKEIDMQVQEAQRVPIMMDAKRATPRHIIIKKPKVKDKEMEGGCVGEWVRGEGINKYK